MKRLILAIFLLLPILAHSQEPQNGRWVLLFENKTTNTKNYVDTQTIEYLDYFEGKQNVCLIWVRSLRDFSNGVFHQQGDQHLAITLDANQYGIKSYTGRKDGIVTETKQFPFVTWNDIEPETNAEYILNYCKSHRK